MANNLADLQQGFHNPPVDFSTAPFWVWNDKVTKEKIDLQLQDYKNHGISMLFVHPRPGLITEYLSAEWFELVAYAVEKAKSLNMKLWLYDENSYPSGFAGGHVPAATYPDADPVAGLQMQKFRMLNPDDTTAYYLIIKKMGDSFANITSSREKYYDKPGEYYTFKKWYYPSGDGWYGGFSYVDLLAYGITEKFIKTTMDGYEDYLGDELGKTVPGIFTDEPNINTIGGGREVLRYTPVLFKRFEDKYGYQLQTYLPCLFEKTGDWKNVRHDYYALLLDMFIKRWSVPWNQYTDKQHMTWTGHYWEHGWPDPRHGGDNMAMYAYHQMPGIDMLFNTDKRPDQFGNIRSVKELASVANQLDRSRTMSETYGGSGWELTFGDMKRQGDWEYVLGVNFMTQHLSYMTLKGARKRDYPQSFSYHNPLWDQYPHLAKYFQRLSFALSSGKQVNDILVIEPTTTAWMLHSPILKNPNEEALKTSFHRMLKKLEKHQVEYDLGSENIIKNHGKVQNGRFVIGARSYRQVILPPGLDNLDSATYALLLSYLQKKGKVISLCGIPGRLDGNASKTMIDNLTKYETSWTFVDSLDEKLINTLHSGKDFLPEKPGDWGGNVFHHQRQLQDGRLLFFTNYHRTETAHIRFAARGQSVLVLDPLTGNIAPYKASAAEGMEKVAFSLPPTGSKMLYFSDKKRSEPAPSTDDRPYKQLEASATTVQRLAPNTLTLDYCNLQLGGHTYKDLYFYNAADTIYKHFLKTIYGYNYNPWSNAVQYRTRILDKDTFGNNTGFEAGFPFYIEKEALPAHIQAVVERPDIFKVKINGHAVAPMKGEWWLDRDFAVYDLADLVSEGRNILTVQCTPMRILAELEPVYLLGDFGVAPAEKGWKITHPAPLQIGSWKDQLMPFYSQKVTYQKSFDLAKEDVSRPLRVQLTGWQGTTAQVKLNGQDAGIIAWPPYQLDIRDGLQPGNNKVEVIIIGSLKNQLGPHHNHPEHGFVTPWSFFRAPLHQPPAEEYDLLPYGLTHDFELWMQ